MAGFALSTYGRIWGVHRGVYPKSRSDSSPRKLIVAAFDMPHASSDGGAVLLKSLDTSCN